MPKATKSKTRARKKKPAPAPSRDGRAQIHIYTSPRLKKAITASRFREEFQPLGEELSVSKYIQAICGKLLEAERANPTSTWDEIWARVIGDSPTEPTRRPAQKKRVKK